MTGDDVRTRRSTILMRDDLSVADREAKLVALLDEAAAEFDGLRERAVPDGWEPGSLGRQYDPNSNWVTGQVYPARGKWFWAIYGWGIGNYATGQADDWHSAAIAAAAAAKGGET